MKQISVTLYGGKGLFGGKETPLEAELIFCDRAKECSYYQSGQCLENRAMFNPGCKFGKSQTIKGYTSRAAKYTSFKERYTKDPLYNKTSFPKSYVAVMGDTLFINSGYVDVNKRRDDEKWRRTVGNDYVLTDPGFGTGRIYLPMEDVSNELLKELFSFHPQLLMGNDRTNAWKKRVRQILQDMKACTPEIYQRFTAEYPEYIFEMDYIGKKAYVSSLKPGTRFTQNQNTWIYDGEYVSSVGEIDIGLVSPWWHQNGTKTAVRIKVNDEMTFTVESNDIIDGDVRFT